MSEEAKWYVIHTYSGYESMVEQNIRKMAESNNIQDMIVDIAIPVEDDIVEKNGKKKVVEHKKFPGYVFIKMVHTKQMWYMVTSTRGVTGFVGPSSRAIPLSPEEVRRMGLEKITVPSDAFFTPGDKIKIVSGALESFAGVVDSVNNDRKKARVMVSMFDRETIVDLDFAQIDKI